MDDQKLDIDFANLEDLDDLDPELDNETDVRAFYTALRIALDLAAQQPPLESSAA